MGRTKSLFHCQFGYSPSILNVPTSEINKTITFLIYYLSFGFNLVINNMNISEGHKKET